MARLLSLPVLGGGVVLASPALWAAFVEGTMAVETGVTRFAAAVAFVWVGLSLIGSLVAGTSGPPAPRDAPPVQGAGPVHGSVVEPRP